MRKSGMRPTTYGLSWIRRWFLKQDDFVLWMFFIIIMIVQITAAFAVITGIAKAIFL